MTSDNTWHVSNGDGEVTFDLAPLADDCHFVHDGCWVEEIAQVDE